ncbi:restriction endonuclease subunit S [Pedobacter sp. KACC 23697]|uniref:Restriction endonuclease subunit S n=1 Tax=Pedobacter sp. KACC 23697 TaxID=3149230 RepID=A0AAU7K8U2_9SPHI
MEYHKLERLVSITTGKYDANHATTDGDFLFYTCALGQFKSPTYSFDGEAILLPGNGANVGEVFYNSGAKFEVYQRTYVLQGFNGFYKYLYFYLKSFWKKSLINSQYGSATNYIRLSNIQGFEIPIPTYENQIRIANLLEKIENTITERKNTIDLLGELVKATFYQMFGDPAKIPSPSLISLDEVSTQITDGEHTTPKRTNQGIKLLSARNIQNGYLNFSKGVDYIGQNEYERISRRCSPEYNDILLSCSGTVGRVAVINIHEPFALVRSVALIKPKHNIVNSYYLMYWLQSTFLQNEITRNSKKSSQANIFTGAIKQLPIFLPPIAFQNQFADIAQKIENIKVKQEAQLTDLKELYATVSNKVFTGDIDLSKLPVDASLLPNYVEVPTNKEPKDRHDIFEQKEVSKEEVEKVKTKNIKGLEFGFQAVRHLESWEHYSFKEIADRMIKHFSTHYFNAEMILNYLDKELDIQVNYYSSAEQKKNPQYENADDFYRFMATALTGENHFLTLEQVFYNAETENIPNISFTELDVESLSKKDKSERSGIYFYIKDEITTP